MGICEVHSMNLPPETKIPPSFKEGAIEGVVCKTIKAYTDQRGWLMEIYREDELAGGISSGNGLYERNAAGHRPRAARTSFSSRLFRLSWSRRILLVSLGYSEKSPTYGCSMRMIVGQSNPCTVVVPPGVVHAYKNVGDVPGWVFNLPNQLYAGEGRKEPVDEIRHENDPYTPFTLD